VAAAAQAPTANLVAVEAANAGHVAPVRIVTAGGGARAADVAAVAQALIAGVLALAEVGDVLGLPIRAC
jgi:hypothetical protein